MRVSVRVSVCVCARARVCERGRVDAFMSVCVRAIVSVCLLGFLASAPFCCFFDWSHSFNHLLLPEYPTMEKLKERLMVAISHSEGFGTM